MRSQKAKPFISTVNRCLYCDYFAAAPFRRPGLSTRDFDEAPAPIRKLLSSLPHLSKNYLLSRLLFPDQI